MVKINLPDEVLQQRSRVDKPKEVAKGKAKAAKAANKNIGDPSYDLIKVFEQRDIADMDDEEYETRIRNLQRMRLMRFTTIKKVTPLDIILSAIDMDKAQDYLEKLKAYDEKKQENAT